MPGDDFQLNASRLRARIIACVGFLGVTATAYAASVARPLTDAPWYGIVPPLLAVTMALLTSRMLSSLLVAVLVGGWLSAWHTSQCMTTTTGLGLLNTRDFFRNALSSSDSQLILLYVVLIMAAIAVVLVGGGLQGVANALGRFAHGRRSTQFVTFLAGLVIFIDDYANTMIVGSTMRPMTDRQRISREKLAFLVDATAAPIAGIALISTWVGYEVGLLGEIAETLIVDRTGYAMFFDALGYRFYCITMIAFVAICAATGIDYGPMSDAERRAQTKGLVAAEKDRVSAISLAMTRAQPHDGVRIHAATALIPMLVMLGAFLGGVWDCGGGTRLAATDATAPFRMSAWREVFGQANSIPLLAWASGIGFALAAACSFALGRTPVSAIAKATWLGLKAAMMPVSVLILAWSLKEACTELQTGDFLAAQLQGTIAPWLFPLLVFLVAGATSFSTGTSWGTMAILIPTAIPVAFALDGGLYGPVTVLTVAAILDGAIFGDHCSPISDTTIMSSAASACHHVAHVRTQLPYSLTVAGIGLTLGYLPAALGYSKWLGISGGIAACLLLFATLSRRRTSPQ